MAFKDFDAARAEAVVEPLSFKLGGETFEVPLPIPGLDLLDLGKQALGQQEGAVDAGSVDMMRNFISSVLGDEAQRFESVARTARIGIDEIMEVFSWIMAEGIGVPTPQQSALEQPSSDGTTSLLGAASTEDSPSQ